MFPIKANAPHQKADSRNSRLKVTLNALITLGIALSPFSLHAQSSNQSPSGPPTDPGLDLDGFGCQIAEAPDCAARIRCVGEGEILFKDNRGVSEAVKVANQRARNELARFFSEKRKAEESLKQAQRTYQKQGPEGERSEREFGRLSEEVTTTSVEAVLRGVVLIGRQIDLQGGMAKVWVGQTCRSRAVAEGRAQPSARASGGEAAPATGGPQIYGGNPQSTKRPNLDRF